MLCAGMIIAACGGGTNGDKYENDTMRPSTTDTTYPGVDTARSMQDSLKPDSIRR